MPTCSGCWCYAGIWFEVYKSETLGACHLTCTCTIIPETRRTLFSKVPETSKPLLSVEIDKVAQDYRVHRDEIYTKLVQIMRERLLAHLHGLLKVFEGWNRPPNTTKQTKEFAWPLTREVGYLHLVLSETLHEADVQAIFR